MEFSFTEILYVIHVKIVQSIKTVTGHSFMLFYVYLCLFCVFLHVALLVVTISIVLYLLDGE